MKKSEVISQVKELCKTIETRKGRREMYRLTMRQIMNKYREDIEDDTNVK